MFCRFGSLILSVFLLVGVGRPLAAQPPVGPALRPVSGLPPPTLVPPRSRPRDRFAITEQRLEQIERRYQDQVQGLSERLEAVERELQQSRSNQSARLSGFQQRQAAPSPQKEVERLLKQAQEGTVTATPGGSAPPESVEQDIEKLLQEAEPRRDINPPELGAGLGAKLSAFNPNISLIGDFFGITSTAPDGPGQTRIPLGFFDAGDVDTFSFREIELMATAAIDPFSDALVKLAFNHGGVEIEEAYALFHDYPFRDLLPEWLQDVHTKVGQFRMAFGPLNLVDEHDLPTVDEPLANQRFLGEGGLIRAGVSFSKVLPFSDRWTSELTLEFTNGEPLGDEAGAAPFQGIEHPLGLVHYELSRDFQPDPDWEARRELGCRPRVRDGRRTLTLGSTFAATGNRVQATSENPYSLVEGLNATWQWYDPRPDSYRQWLLQGEAFFSQLEQPDAGTNFDAGGYVLGQMRLNREWFVGTRYDITEFPDRDGFQLAATPFLTYFMTEFNRLRLQYQFLHQETDGAGSEETHTVWIQLVFAYGAHPPEPYYLGARF